MPALGVPAPMPAASHQLGGARLSRQSCSKVPAVFPRPRGSPRPTCTATVPAAATATSPDSTSAADQALSAPPARPSPNPGSPPSKGTPKSKNGSSGGGKRVREPAGEVSRGAGSPSTASSPGTSSSPPPSSGGRQGGNQAAEALVEALSAEVARVKSVGGNGSPRGQQRGSAKVGATLRAAASADLSPLGPKQLTKLSWAAGKLCRSTTGQDRGQCRKVVSNVSSELHRRLRAAAPSSRGGGTPGIVLRDCTPSDLCMCLLGAAWAGATPPPQVMDAIGAAAMAQLPKFNPQGLSNLSWALSRLRYSPLRGKLLAGMSAEVARRDMYNQFGAQALCNFLAPGPALDHRFPAPVVEGLARRALALAPDLPPQACSSLVWSFATMGLDPLQGGLLDGLLAGMSGRMTSSSTGGSKGSNSAFRPQHLANVLLGCAQLGHGLPPAVLDEIATAALECLPQWTPKDYGMFCNALSRLGSDPLDGRLLDQALVRLLDKKDGLLLTAATTTTYSSFTSSRTPLGPLLANSSSSSASLPSSTPFSSLATTASSSSPSSSASLAASSPSSSSPSSSAGAAASKLGGSSPGRSAGGKGSGWDDPQTLCAVLVAATRLGRELQAWQMDAIAQAALGRLDGFSPLTYGKIAWAFAKQKYHPLGGELLPRLADSLVVEGGANAGMLARFNEQDISNFMWAASYLDCQLSPEFQENVAAVALKKLDSFSADTAAALMTTFANLEHSPLDGKLQRAVTLKLDAARRAAAKTAASGEI